MDAATQQWAMQMQQQRQMIETTGALSTMCFEKCYLSSGDPGTKKLGKGGDQQKTACIENCVKRFLESTAVVTNRIAHGTE
eukprot:m.50962 g.50962  ORF g.50962 m.50962 type:complete len:81 (+) comp21369_c0_seq1:46-288(+)